MPLAPGEEPKMKKVMPFPNSLLCYPLTGAIESSADTLPAVIQEMLLAKTSERQGQERSSTTIRRPRWKTRSRKATSDGSRIRLHRPRVSRRI